MYILKICMDKKTLDVKYYEHFENAFADIISTEGIFDNIPKEIVENLEDSPRMYYGSVDNNGVADDFEFRYKNGLNIYVGQIITEEEKTR